MNNFTELTTEMLSSVEKAIGIHVTVIIAEHALWRIKEKYEEASLITISEDGIVIDKLNTLDPERAKLIIQEFIKSFVTTLSRLVGKQLAQQLTVQLQHETNISGEV